MENSILKSTKKVLGLSPDDDSFDEDVILFINSVLADLNQLGVGPVNGFTISDDAAEWVHFLGSDVRLSSVKTYVYLRVRLLFDPPQTPHVLASMKEQIQEQAWRINVVREGVAYPSE